jgi:hypothetical protein
MLEGAALKLNFNQFCTYWRTECIDRSMEGVNMYVCYSNSIEHRALKIHVVLVVFSTFLVVRTELQKYRKDTHVLKDRLGQNWKIKFEICCERVIRKYSWVS